MHYRSEVASMRAHDEFKIGARRPVPLPEIDAIVAARLGPGRVRGNAQPAAFSRQVAIYVANQVGGRSTRKIGKFYNGRDRSTVCYAIARIRARRRTDEGINGLLTVLANEIRKREQAKENFKSKALKITGKRASRSLHCNPAGSGVRGRSVVCEKFGHGVDGMGRYTRQDVLEPGKESTPAC
jgi:hypothetical protein